MNLLQVDSERVTQLKEVVFINKENSIKEAVLVFDFFEHDLFGIARRGRKWTLSEAKTLFKHVSEGLIHLKTV